MPTMLVLALGNHVASVQHPSSSRRNAMSFSKLVQKVKSEIAFYKGLVKDTEGASGIEYAIVAGMAAVVLVTFMTPIAGAVKGIFDIIKLSLVPTP
jgi:pilus assembly protein Flp/PilA